MTDPPSIFDQHTDAAIEALVDMYLSRPHTSSSPDTSPDPSSLTPPHTPTPDHTALAPPHVEAVLVGHLPGLANPWLSQYADFRARPGRPVALCHLFAQQVEIELVLAGPDDRDLLADRLPPLPDRPQPDDLPRLCHALAPLVGLWLVPLGQLDTTTAGSACQALATWTLLSGADPAAVVAAYRLLKQARSLDPHHSHAHRLQLMLAGCQPHLAQPAADKILRAARQFLDMPAQYLGLRPRMQPVCKQRLGIFPNPDRPAAQPQWAGLLQFFTTRLQPPTDRPDDSSPTSPPSSQSTVADDAAPPHTQADSPSPSDSTAPAADLQQRPPLRLHIDQPSDSPCPHSGPPNEDEPAADLPGPLSRFVPDLQTLPLRCPLDEQVELAVDPAGTVHLLARADGLAVFKGAAVLMAVRDWLAGHAALVHQATRLDQLNTAHPVLHLFTDTPKPILPFCLAGSPLQPTLRLHLLTTLPDLDRPRCLHVELN